MVETITPVVHGGRRGPWAAAVALHVLGAAAGAAALGAALGAAGRILGAPWGEPGAWGVVAMALVYAGRELLGIPVPIPDRKRQVPEWWRTFFGPHAASLLYGLGLGVGFLTYLRHGTLVAVAALAVARGDPLLGALVFLPFGAARGLTVLAAAPADRSEAVTAVLARLEGSAISRTPRMVNGAILLLVAVAAALAGPATGPTGGPNLAGELLAVLFTWAAVGKLSAFPRWRRQLRAYRVPLDGPLAVAVPLAEVGVAALALAGVEGGAAALALALLAAFSLAILRARRFHGDRLPCGCFGGRSGRDFRVLLGRNAALGGLAALSVADRAAALATVGPAEILPVTLIALGLTVALLLGREARRLGGAGSA